MEMRAMKNACRVLVEKPKGREGERERYWVT
jgi:hypothetical protein